MSVNCLDSSWLVPPPGGSSDGLGNIFSNGFESLSIPSPRGELDIDDVHGLAFAGDTDAQPAPQALADIYSDNPTGCSYDVHQHSGPDAAGLLAHAVAIVRARAGPAEQKRMSIRERNRVNQANYRDRFKVCVGTLILSL